MAIAVIGAAGQLGQELCALLGSKAVPLVHRDVELTDRASLVRSLQAIGPRTVINAAAYNRVDEAEERPADALAVNSLGVRELAQVCRDLDATLVHFSTDYVFGSDAERSTPYEEEDAPGPISVYGVSKLAGEYFARAISGRHLIIRSCGLYSARGVGGKGRNFVDTMLRVGRERGAVRVVCDQVCTPTYAADLARATIELVAAEAVGLFHWTNAGSCSWYEFAGEIFRTAGLAVKCEPITAEQYGARAKRPHYSVLSTARYESLGFAAPRPWQAALAEYLRVGRSENPPRADDRGLA